MQKLKYAKMFYKRSANIYHLNQIYIYIFILSIFLTPKYSFCYFFEHNSGCVIN